MMKICCESYVANAVPRNPKEGVFKEVHSCLKHKARIKITFEEKAALGDEG